MESNRDNQPMRPIPDGGLKESMPSWLTRPPAWRQLPTPQERHERSLPEPDTSEIDPRTLVDVTDLPQWLQAIAERGPLPAPEPDPVREHAVQVVQQAQAALGTIPGKTPVDLALAAPDIPERELPASEPGVSVPQEDPVPEVVIPDSAPVMDQTTPRGLLRSPLVIVAVCVIIALLAIAIFTL